MVALRGQRRTGVLSVDAEGTRTFIYLKEGVPVFAEEGTSGETLGRLLVRLKRITQEQYLTVLSKMTHALVFNEQLRFGETAVELGFMTEEQVNSALHNQVRWKVIRCFQRDEVAWSFVDNEAEVAEVGNFPMTLESLVFDAVLWLDSEHRNEAGLGGMLERFVYIPANERADVGRRLGLDPSVLPGLSALDGQRRAREIITRAGDIEWEAVLTTMAMLGMPVFLSEKPKDVAPVQAGPPPAPAPAAQLPRAVPLDRTRTSQVLRQLDSMVRSYQLTDGDLFKQPASPHEERLIAEHAFQRGRAHLAAGRDAQASRALRRAVQLAPANAEYAVLALWCDHKDRFSKDEDSATLLKREVVGAIRKDPNFAFGYYILGSLAFAAKDLPQAKRFFLKTISLDPAIVDATIRVRLIEARGSSDKR